MKTNWIIRKPWYNDFTIEIAWKYPIASSSYADKKFHPVLILFNQNHTFLLPLNLTVSQHKIDYIRKREKNHLQNSTAWNLIPFLIDINEHNIYMNVYWMKMTGKKKVFFQLFYVALFLKMSCGTLKLNYLTSDMNVWHKPCAVYRFIHFHVHVSSTSHI